MAEAIDLYDLASFTRRCRIDFSGVENVHEPWFVQHAQAFVGKLGHDPAFVSLKKALKD